MSRRWAVIDPDSNRVLNVVEWDGETPWAPEVGFLRELADEWVSPLHSVYDRGSDRFTPDEQAPPPELLEPDRSPEQVVAALVSVLIDRGIGTAADFEKVIGDAAAIFVDGKVAEVDVPVDPVDPVVPVDPIIP